MANQDAAYGFRPVSLHGTDPQFNVFAPQGYSIASAYGTTLNMGDPVKSSGTADAKGRPGIVIGTNGPILGSFGGCEYTDSVTGERKFSKHWPAATVATDIVANVYDHPETLFSVQASGDVAATDISNKADFVSGTGANGISGYELDSSTIGSQDCLRIQCLDASVPVNDFGANAKVLVKFKEHEHGATLTAVS